MKPAPEPEHSVQTLQNDLLRTATAAGVKIASFGQTWRALTLWILSTAARNRPTWLLVAAVAVLIGFFPVVGWFALAVVVGYWPVMTAVAAYITLNRTWTLLIDETRTAIIGFRIWQNDDRTELILDSHRARRPGTGQGRRLRSHLGPHLGDALTRHPSTVVRFRAQNQRLAGTYLDELKTVLPESAQWSHHLDGVHGTVRRDG
ncbi:hypothetical protein [Kineosporia sp. NBRC 101731]|uniref:hypothetical protein n=1 Tax=Kineosporia sp. NBRC 101731 TaxID=3032199 RepID=UPI0024A323FD|nr:hypothetical protein [Kineosporia sp. NBRC 101731]GLY32288.1 hypothetical protein Kisp02_56530 [Kineosporia sp. NBRC 101731]